MIKLSKDEIKILIDGMSILMDYSNFPDNYKKLLIKLEKEYILNDD